MSLRLFLLLAIVVSGTRSEAYAQTGKPSDPEQGAMASITAISGEKPALERGREAMEEGRHAAAVQHFLYALSRTEKLAMVMALLLENAQNDADAFALWAIDLSALVVGADGRLKFAGEAKKLMGKDGAAQKLLGELAAVPVQLAKARALALREIKKRIGKKSKSGKIGTRVEIEWLEDLARAIAAPSPKLQASLAGQGPLIESGLRDWRPVTDALRRAANSAISNARYDDAIRAARCLRGMVAQAGFGDDLKGPTAPDMTSEGSAANNALGRARAALAKQPELEFTIEQLERMGLDQQRQLTVDRASFARPSVCDSPRGWYRVETSCGWETLYGGATTVEYHHDRLVNWYGRDPFIGRPGILRLVPEAHGLEAEGAPFWWAGGFQGGDTTTLKFTMGTIPGLGRGITHELTHRFDGGMYGGLPAWLSEGRASWTGGAYGSMKETQFVANHCSFGTMSSTRTMGYGRQEELEKLIAGTLEEYRDNYTAGYGLYVYLNTWSGSQDVDDPILADDSEEIRVLKEGKEWGDQAPFYHERLQMFMNEKKRLRNDPVKVFEYYFADGENGRPEGIKEFAQRFDRYLAGFYWKEPAAWRDRYTQAVPGSDPAPKVYDEPTWTWLRNRAEPWFGQDHARMAGEIFADLGKHDDAVNAFTWSMAVDELSLATVLRFADELLQADNLDAAWMMLHWQRFQAGGGHEFILNTGEGVKNTAENRITHLKAQALGGQPAPFAGQLSALQALLEIQAEGARKFATAGQMQTAAALMAERNRLAGWLGLERNEQLAAATPVKEDGLHPFDRPWYLLGHGGWIEPDLTGHEDRLVSGLWFEDEAGSMHVGRKNARGGTGKMDRTSHWRDAVVMSNRWMEPGRYSIRTQIEQTTAFLSGGIVFGYTRRDRNIRLGFSMGDYNFAIGKDEQLGEIKGVRWSLDGLYARRGAQSGTHRFGQDRSFFQVEIQVDGPTAEVFLDGDHYATFSTLDSSAIQGRIGFYTSTGALKALNPEIRRLDRSQTRPGALAVGGGLHPSRPGQKDWRELISRPVTGLPLATSGTVLLWFPEQTEQKLSKLQPGDWYERVADDLDRAFDILEPEFPSQGLLVMLPPSFPEDQIAALRDDFAQVMPGGFEVRRHQRPESLEEDRRTVQGWTRPVLAFIDPTGFLRYAKRQSRFSRSLPDDLRLLLIQHQDHSRPGTAGAGD
jgi:hypothetical protein